VLGDDASGDSFLVMRVIATFQQLSAKLIGFKASYVRMCRMRARSFLLALFLVTFISVASAKTYLTGKLIHVDSAQAIGLGIYTIYIQQGDRTYSVRIVEKPTYKLEWAVNDPVEFRLTKDAIYLKRLNGKEMKFPLLKPSKAEDNALREKPDLPFPSAPPQPVSDTRAVPPETTTSKVPRCAEIAAMDPQFGPLTSACEFALSPRNLPNFICQETMQRATRGLSNSKWTDLDVVTVEVTFANGRGDRYSKFAINGRPLNLPPDIHGDFALLKFLQQQNTGGWWDLAEFGTELVAVFNPLSQANFKFNGEVNLPSGPSTQFDFHLDRASGFSIVLPTEGRRFHPGLAGSFWIDRNSGKLLRMDVFGTGFDSSFPVISDLSATNYGDVAISDIGSFLLPTAGEAVECDRFGMCYKNVLSFHDCRKFGAESHIVPNPEDDH